MNLEHEWKDAKKNKSFLQDRSPTVHVGTSNPVLQALGAKKRTQTEVVERPHRVVVSQTKKRGPIPSKTNLQGTRRSGTYKRKETATRRQEVADGKPFRKKKTAGYRNSHRGQARDTQRHRLGTQEPNSPNEDRLVIQAARSVFLNPTAEVQDLPRAIPES